MNNPYKKNIFFLQLTTLWDSKFCCFNLGMLSIATLLKKSGFSVECLKSDQLESLTYENKEKYFKTANPEIIGFNINSDNIHSVVYFARDLKKWLPDVIILVGGPLVSIMMETVLDEPSFDMAIVGEGEFPTLKLCNKIIKNKGCFEDIEGLIYRKDGKVITNPKGALIENLDILPTPDYTLTDACGAFSYFSGRGCPFNCSFCFQGVHGRGYRYFSAGRVVNDIINISEKHKMKAVAIGDDTFIANPKRTVQICEGLIKEKNKRNLKFSIWCEGRIDTLYRHPELLDILKKAGLVKLQLGIENGNQEVLDAYNKHITLEQIEAVVSNVANEMIFMNGNIIIGGPFETYKTFEKSLEFAIKLMRLSPGLLEINPVFLCPYPGTDITKNPDKYGLTIIDANWLKSLSTLLPSLTTKDLNVFDLMNLKHIFLDRAKIEMLKMLKIAGFETMSFHMYLSSLGFETDYYQMLLHFAPVIKKYFELKNKSSRFRLDEMNYEKLLSSKPIGLIRPLYSGKNYILEGYFDKIDIKKPEEKLIYDFSTGKLNIVEIAQFVKSKLSLDNDIEPIIKTIMIPFYKRIEKSYHIIFQI